MFKRSCVLLLFFTLFLSPIEAAQEIRFVPIGDSYTAGTGALPGQAWPILLTSHLRKDGLNIKLVANPAQNGWTTQAALDKELPVFKQAKPDFATLMIGVNDWVQGVSPKTFRANFAKLADEMLTQVKDKQKLLIINIPDFSCAPKGPLFSRGRNISQGLKEFNKIIEEESKKRGLAVVDIFSVSRVLCGNPEMISYDGLHPSGTGYLVFQEVIYSYTKKILK